MRLKKTIQSMTLASCCLATSLSVSAQMNPIFAEYCQQVGGVAEEMQAELATHHGLVKTEPKAFCNFYLPDAFVSIGLECFASEKPSIAATWMKTLENISNDSPLWQGNYSNPSMNVCKNLGGASIGFVAHGGFANSKGQTDICFFGDGSMVSAWSLIYMANHRAGYDAIKEHIRAIPLAIRLPV